MAVRRYAPSDSGAAFASVPPAAITRQTSEVVDLARQAGLLLDPWQAAEASLMTAMDEHGRWLASEGAIVCPRQNGKNAVLEAIELAGLFLWDEPMIVHSAHLFSTAAEAWRRLRFWIDNTDWLRQRVKRIVNTPAEMGCELTSGARIRFLARTNSGSGRGFAVPRLILDEAFAISDAMMGAVVPAMSAQSTSQMILTSSSGWEGTYFARVRDRGRAGSDANLAYFEHCAPDDAPSDSEDAWRIANPAYPYRISRAAIEKELEALTDEDFRRERLGAWTGAGEGAVISASDWGDGLDEQAQPSGPIAFGVAVNWSQSAAAVGVARLDDNSNVHVDLVDHRQGLDWVPGCLQALLSRHPNSWGVVMDEVGPSTALAPILRDVVDVTTTKTTDITRACALFATGVAGRTVFHRGNETLTAAVKVGKRRGIGDAWAWDRRASDISPLEAVTLAAWRLTAGMTSDIAIFGFNDLGDEQLDDDDDEDELDTDDADNGFIY